MLTLLQVLILSLAVNAAATDTGPFCEEGYPVTDSFTFETSCRVDSFDTLAHLEHSKNEKY